MLNIRPYFSNDYSKLLPFLKKFDPTVVDETWEKLLEYKWENPHNYRGMLLENNDEIVGFLCYILSIKQINEIDYTYCNISSWVVNHEFRSKSLQLLAKLLPIKNLILVNLSPHENTLSIFEALRFDTLSEFEYRVNPFKLKYTFLKNKKNADITFKEITESNVNQFSLESKIKKVIYDHRYYANVHFYELTIAENNKIHKLLIAFNRKKIALRGFKNHIKELPYILFGKTYQLELLYCSQSELLQEFFGEIMFEVISLSSARSINVSEHFLNKINLQIPSIAKIKKDRPWFLYTDGIIKYSDIDILYSEKVLLNF